jgi:hypothetical protein
MSLVLQSSGGGQITIQEPATASNFTQTLPAATGTTLLDSTVGVCRAWVSFNGSTTATILQSFNVSSVTYNSTGIYTVNITNALSTTNGAAISSAGINANSYAFSCATSSITTTTCKIGVTEANGNFTNDATIVCFAIFR